MTRKKRVDKVRASRDGHEFHEAWVARKAMQLLLPNGDLTALAVEGLSPIDRANASVATIEIADITLYYGGGDSFDKSTRITLAQFKYSIAAQDKEFRASNAKKTVEKLAKSYRDYKKRYNAQLVDEKLDFQLITNQPISENLIRAIDAIATGKTLSGDIKTQANQITTASKLTGRSLAAFARKLKIIGSAGSLLHTKNILASVLIDWSAAGNDSLATARLG